MEAMQRLMAGRTTFMIAHRLSTLDVCDARLSLEHGRIVEATGNIARRGFGRRPGLRAETCAFPVSTPPPAADGSCAGACSPGRRSAE